MNDDSMSFYLHRKLKNVTIKVSKGAFVEAVDGSEVVLIREGKESSLKNPDDVIPALGARSRGSLSKEIRPFVQDVQIIGDTGKPRKALNAIFEEYEAERLIE